jgi:hypothetical protein
VSSGIIVSQVIPRHFSHQRLSQGRARKQHINNDHATKTFPNPTFHNCIDNPQATDSDIHSKSDTHHLFIHHNDTTATHSLPNSQRPTARPGAPPPPSAPATQSTPPGRARAPRPHSRCSCRSRLAPESAVRWLMGVGGEKKNKKKKTPKTDGGFGREEGHSD